jgi:hypothetical protein
MSDVHVYPVNDLKEHDVESRYCSCRPKLEEVEGGMVVVHNSWDGREIREQAEDHAFGIGKQ